MTDALKGLVCSVLITFTFFVPAGSQAQDAGFVPPGFITDCGTQLCLDGEVFRFISLAAPELSMRENPYWDVATEFDQEDIIRTVAAMGGRVTRTYVLSIAGVGKDPVHVEAPGKYNEAAFQSLDRVLALAGKHDVKVIIPFIDTWEWWGGINQLSAMNSVASEDFFTREVTKGAYKDLVAYTLNRVNTVTGIRYKDDPAVLAWETGNELRNAPAAWTHEMAAFIKSIDPYHLVIDGNDEHNDPSILADPNIDIVTRHYYGADFVGRFRKDLADIAGRKPLLIGEFGLTSYDAIEQLIDAAVDNGAVGAMIWSLRNHDSHGGWHWHCESAGGCAYHFPGFAAGDEYRESDVLEKLQDAAWKIRGEPRPAPAAPDVPTLLPIETPLDIKWLGSVGADSYDLERSRDGGVTWEVLAGGIADSLNAPFLRYRRDVIDLQSGSDHPAALFRIILQDEEVKTGEEVSYRVRATGPGGTSDWSDVVSTQISLTDGVRLIHPDDPRLSRMILRFSEETPVTGVEIWTAQDPTSIRSGCLPQIISAKTVQPVQVIDEPALNPGGSIIVATPEAVLGAEFSVAQPCRGEVIITGLRYGFGDYHLDSPTPPKRDLPFGEIDTFEIYGADLSLTDRWNQNAGGNAIEFELHEGALSAAYTLGTPSYAGISRVLPRENWSKLDGIRFRYRGQGGTQGFTLQFQDSSGYWETTIAPPTEDWAEVRIPFAEFAEPPWSAQDRDQSRTGVIEFSIYVGGPEGGMFEIDEIGLY